MTLNGNWVDLVLLIVLLIYIIEGLERGFWFHAANLVSFLGSLLAAVRFYSFVAKLLVINFSLSYGFANALGFFFVAIVAELVLGTIFYLVMKKIPQKLVFVWWNRLLGILPAVLDGLVLIAFFLTVLIILPLSPFLKKDVASSRIGGYLVGRTISLEQQFKKIFGGAAEETLAFLTVKPNSQERVDLRFQVREFSVDDTSEAKMFGLVNAEREKHGLNKLKWDFRLMKVATEHSVDMITRGYFSHYSPEGVDVGGRLKALGIAYLVAGENLAFAPSVDIAHVGLMNSPGHRSNLLSSEFSRIGIGVVDGGIYGKMFTQIFIN